MIRKIFNFLPGKKKAEKTRKLTVIPRSDHKVSRNDISDHALKVLYRLNKSGFEAFLVGGGVRDLLLGIHPKDFDIATSAHPEEVNRLFRNSRLIGRRFKLVHVLFGREIIEVATFRGQHTDDKKSEDRRQGNQQDRHRKSSEHGMILRDNVYGTMEEDAIRRDFTVNALYYCVKDFSIYDYAGGLKDLEARKLQLIGDPESRYREDPVRMLRAVRFATKLDFAIAKETHAPIEKLAHLLAHIPAARLFDEILKLFLSGHALDNFRLLRKYGLFAHLFPATEKALESNGELALTFIENALRNTDKRILANKPVTPAFLFAALLWSPLQTERNRLKAEGNSEFPALHLASQHIINQQSGVTSIPKRFGIPMKEIWEMQLRLPKRAGKRAEQIASHPRFRAAYDFVLLREESGENLNGLGQWWTAYQESDPHGRRKLLRSLDGPAKGGRKRKRKPRPGRPSSAVKTD